MMTCIPLPQQPVSGPAPDPALVAALDELDLARTEIMHLQRALDSRVAIEQAKGYLAAVAEVSTASAFRALRRYSRNRNLRLHDVSREVVAGTLGHPAELLQLARSYA